jgi:hypothetical protein
VIDVWPRVNCADQGASGCLPRLVEWALEARWMTAPGLAELIEPSAAPMNSTYASTEVGHGMFCMGAPAKDRSGLPRAGGAP